jgi:Domain of unknown function (DUF4188)
MVHFPQLLPEGPTASSTLVTVGIRINRLWRPDHWVPSVALMVLLAAKSSRHRPPSCLDQRFMVEPRGLSVIQYWRREDGLHRYLDHQRLWAPLQRRVAQSHDSVGFFSESYDTQRVESQLDFIQ